MWGYGDDYRQDAASNTGDGLSAAAPTPEVWTADLVWRIVAYRTDRIGRLIADTLVIVDLRTKAEYEVGHIPGAINIPLAELDQRITELPNKLPVFYCDCPG